MAIRVVREEGDEILRKKSKIRSRFAIESSSSTSFNTAFSLEASALNASVAIHAVVYKTSSPK